MIYGLKTLVCSTSIDIQEILVSLITFIFEIHFNFKIIDTISYGLCLMQLIEGIIDFDIDYV